MCSRVARARRSSPQVNVSRSPGLQLDDVLAQRADPQLRPGQVLQDRDRPPRAAGGVAHAPDRLGVLLERPVRVVQPRHVHPGLDHPQQRLRLARGGSDGGDDLRAAHARTVSISATAGPLQTDRPSIAPCSALATVPRWRSRARTSAVSRGTCSPSR